MSRFSRGGGGGSWYLSELPSRMLWIILLICLLQRGHTGLTLVHSTRQTKQNLWLQAFVWDIFSNFPRHIAQDGSGDLGLVLEFLSASLVGVLFEVFWSRLVSSSLVKRGGLFGGGVIAASPSGKVGGVGGHSKDDMVSHRIFAKPRSPSTSVLSKKWYFCNHSWLCWISLELTRLKRIKKL